jgi:hypothetical protein
MTLSLCCVPLLLCAQVETPTFKWETQRVCVEGEPWPVKISLEMPLEESPAMPCWILTPTAFTVNGRTLGKREAERVALQPGLRMEMEYDLWPTLLRQTVRAQEPASPWYRRREETCAT